MSCDDVLDAVPRGRMRGEPRLQTLGLPCGSLFRLQFFKEVRELDGIVSG